MAAKDHGPRFIEIVDRARARVAELSVDQVRAMREAGERFELVDVREREEYLAGRIPGARHLGKGVIERDVEAAYPDTDTPLVLYCGGGYRSALAADALTQMGYTRVASMDGGYRGWTKAGLPTEPPAEQL